MHSPAGVRLVTYCVSSAIAIIPWSILFCYFGSLARNITEILEGKAGPSGKQSMMLLAVSGVVLVFVVVYSTIIARCIPATLLVFAVRMAIGLPVHNSGSTLALRSWTKELVVDNRPASSCHCA